MVKGDLKNKIMEEVAPHWSNREQYWTQSEGKGKKGTLLSAGAL